MIDNYVYQMLNIYNLKISIFTDISINKFNNFFAKKWHQDKLEGSFLLRYHQQEEGQVKMAWFDQYQELEGQQKSLQKDQNSTDQLNILYF